MLSRLRRGLAYLILKTMDRVPATKAASREGHMNCVFCTLPEDRHLAANQHFYAVADHNPVTRGHSLVISRRHVETYFELSAEEAASLKDMVNELKAILDKRYQPSGYKLLMNCGAKAGQRVFHFHLHVIPF